MTGIGSPMDERAEPAQKNRKDSAMSIRIRFEVKWTYRREMFIGAWHQDADFEKAARLALHEPFERYHSVFEVTGIETHGLDSTMAFVWEVNLDMVPGSWHQPEDHQRLMMDLLHRMMPNHSKGLVIDIWRQAEFDEALDHGLMLREANMEGITLEADDYPSFKPEQHPSWPEADEVWLQDSFWFWCNSREEHGSICAGPKPKRIFARWEPDFRERSYAEMRKAS